MITGVSSGNPQGNDMGIGGNIGGGRGRDEVTLALWKPTGKGSGVVAPGMSGAGDAGRRAGGSRVGGGVFRTMRFRWRSSGQRMARGTKP